MFTRSLTASAPVDRCRAALKRGKARAILVNSGNANAFTGKVGTPPSGARRRRGRANSAARDERSSSPRPASSASRSTTARSGGPRQALIDRLAPNGWAAAAAAIMTTDTFPKLATRTAAIDDVAGDDQRHRQGLGHDPARHGDHAGLRRHRRQDPGGGAAGAAARGHRPLLQRDHGRRRHLDQRHAAALRATGQAGHPRVDGRRRPAAERFPRQARRAAGRSRLPGRARRRGRAASSSRIDVTGAASATRRAPHRPSRSPIRRWSRPRSPAATPTGAASSWRSARPARRPTATGCGIGIGGVTHRRERPASARTTTRRRSPAT